MEVGAYYRGRKVMITGGLGFLGSSLAIALVDLGARVVLVDALLPLYGGNYYNIEGIKDRVEVHIADIRDSEAMDRLVQGQDTIFNLAAQVSHLDSMTDPLLDLDINARGNLVLLEACRRFNPIVKVVYAGTRGQYGRPVETPVREGHPMRPTDFYGVDKAAAEQYHFLYNKVCGLRAASLRINNTYGPRHQMKHAKYGTLNWLIRLAMEGRSIRVYGDGSQLRDYNYVDDVTEAFLLVGARSEADGEAFNLGSGQPIRFLDLVKVIIETVGNGSYECVPWPQERLAIEVGDYVADYSKIYRLLGWSPKVSLAEGLARTVEFYRRNWRHYWSP
jgi:UDP-glucose 4-epimerase